VKFSAQISPVGFDTHHPLVEGIASNPTPYAAHILRCQASRAMYYGKKNLIIPASNTELIKFSESLGSSMFIIGYIGDSTSDYEDWKLDMDFGLHDGGIQYHVCSWNDCSCQFYKCHELPFRHMNHCCILDPDKVKLEQLYIGEHWMNTPTYVSVPVVDPYLVVPAPTNSMEINLNTLARRRQILSCSCQQMIELASASKAVTKKCLNYVQQFIAGHTKNLTSDSTTGNDDVVNLSSIGAGAGDGNDDKEIIISSLGIGVGNRPISKAQRKDRALPRNPSAPTTKVYKRAGKEINRKRND